MDELLKELRAHFTKAEKDAEVRRKIAEDQARATREGFALIAKSLDNGFLLISNTMLDIDRR